MKNRKNLLIVLSALIVGLALASCQNPFLQLGSVSSQAGLPQGASPSVAPPPIEDGSALYPFLVYDVATLKRVGTEDPGPAAWDLYKHYLQIQDIDMGGEDNWIPIGKFTGQFIGTYNGGGHAISNLYCKHDSEPGELFHYNKVGLFSFIDSCAEVKNLRLINAYIQGENGVGGIAGENWGSIYNCFFSGSVIAKTKNSAFNGQYCGGITGWNDGTIERCYSEGDVSATSDNVGGIVGFNRGGAVKNCYSASDCSAGDVYVGGIVGYSSSILRNCYATGTVSGKRNIGGIAGGISTMLPIYSDVQVRNCVALNQGVSCTISDAFRVGKHYLASIVSNNYADEDMPVNGGTVSGGMSDNDDGEDIDSLQFGSETWWTLDADWEGEGWDFATV